MELKEIVDSLLKEKKLTKSWLASRVKMKPDGFRLALVKHSIKFDEIFRMAEALEVSPSVFFNAPANSYKVESLNNLAQEPNEMELYEMSSHKNEINTLKSQNKKLRDEVTKLKEHLSDKSKIIKLLEEKAK